MYVHNSKQTPSFYIFLCESLVALKHVCLFRFLFLAHFSFLYFVDRYSNVKINALLTLRLTTTSLFETGEIVNTKGMHGTLSLILVISRGVMGRKRKQKLWVRKVQGPATYLLLNLLFLIFKVQKYGSGVRQ